MTQFDQPSLGSGSADLLLFGATARFLKLVFLGFGFLETFGAAAQDGNPGGAFNPYIGRILSVQGRIELKLSEKSTPQALTSTNARNKPLFVSSQMRCSPSAMVAVELSVRAGGEITNVVSTNWISIKPKGTLLPVPTPDIRRGGEVGQYSEERLIKTMSSSKDLDSVLVAIDELAANKTTNTNAFAVFKKMLRNETAAPDPEMERAVARKAARALGDCQAPVDAEDLKIVYGFLAEDRNPRIIMDGLKALRGLRPPDAVTEILPVLKSSKRDVLRDSCRTLAVVGNNEIIPAIEPLLKSRSFDVRKDAQNAIDALLRRSAEKRPGKERISSTARTNVGVTRGTDSDIWISRSK